jgi:hypothetical protein
MLWEVKSEYEREVSEATDRAVQLTFEVTASTSAETCQFVQQALFKLRDALSDDLAHFFRAQVSWAGNAVDQLSNEFLHATDKRIAGAIDDLRHGISGGQRLTKDPLVRVISNISNSPGAILQSGMGNLQKALATQGGSEVRNALQEFINSPEVQNLRTDDKQSIIDVVEVIRHELDQQTPPDASKIARWGKRLLELATQLGVAVAAKGVEHGLFGGAG